MSGRCYGVSVGPGDPELLTLKAARVLSACPVAAVPLSGGGETPVALSIARRAVPELAEKALLALELPMVRDPDELARVREAAAGAIASELRAGRDVAFLTIGDASIYATWSYLQRLLEEMGFETETVPGVPSFCAVAARLGVPLAEAGEPLHIVPASYEGVEEALDWPGTRVLMKSGKALGRVRNLLTEKGLSGRARMVEACGLPGERVFSSMEEADGGEHYLSTIVIKE